MPIIIGLAIFSGFVIAFVWLLIDGIITASKMAPSRETIIALVTQHAQKLALRKHQLVRVDDYGNEKLASWEKERAYFITSTLHKSPAWGNCCFSAKEIFTLIENQIAAVSMNTSYQASMHPADYEKLCGQILSDAGWAVQVTQYSADQGTDVYAEKDGVSVVLQCKLYSRPVGNKAVQEIVGARGYMKADHAAVVSNRSYTPAAQQLAKANGVTLLHHDELLNYSLSISSNAWPATPPGAISIMPPPTTR